MTTGSDRMFVSGAMMASYVGTLVWSLEMATS